MAHKTLVNGTAYEISGGRTLVDGTGYGITGGRTLVNGTGYGISFGTPISSLAVGSSVYMNVNGVRTEFLIVNQGNPDSTRYDSSCNGTWLLMKNIHDVGKWSASGNDYSASAIHNYLQTTFLNLLDSKIVSTINFVKIPYSTGSAVFYGANGVYAKSFLLSGYEVGWTTGTSSSLPVDGACLSYFKGTDASKLIARYNGEDVPWWLRSPRVAMNNRAWMCTESGISGYSLVSDSFGIRPTLILPSNTKINNGRDVLA